MTSSPLIKPERQDVSFAVQGWTPRKNAIQASDSRSSIVDRLRSSLVDSVGEPEFVGFGGPRGSDRAQFPDFDSQFVGRKEPKFVELEHNL